jgi:hypothetical protein
MHTCHALFTAMQMLPGMHCYLHRPWSSLTCEERSPSLGSMQEVTNLAVWNSSF